MPKVILYLALVLLFAADQVRAETSTRQHLFKIERSKNANIVQYDAQVRPDGKLSTKDPVIAYWIRLAEQGQEQPLSWVQKTFAYGFKARPDRDKDTVELEMKADLARPILVTRAGEDYRARIVIDGADSWLEKIFIQAEGRGLSVKVEYVELFGVDVQSREQRYEKFIP